MWQRKRERKISKKNVLFIILWFCRQISDQENELESLKAEVEQEIIAMKKDKENALSDLKRDMRRQSDIISHKYEALRTCFTRLRPGLLMIGEEYKQLRALCKQFPAMLNKAIEETKKEVWLSIHVFIKYQ